MTGLLNAVVATALFVYGTNALSATSVELRTSVCTYEGIGPLTNPTAAPRAAAR